MIRRLLAASCAAGLVAAPAGAAAAADWRTCVRRLRAVSGAIRGRTATPAAAPATAPSSPLPSYFIDDAAYAAYLAWLDREVDTSWTRVANHDLDDVLTNLRLGPADLRAATGRVLLAGEGSLNFDGLYGALRAARGGRDLVAVDHAYVGRTAAMVRGTVTRLPFPDAVFDHVFSHKVAHFLRSHRELPMSPLARNQQVDFIAEVIRVLRPGGVARIGLFVDQHPATPGARSEVPAIRAALDARARIEVVRVSADFSTLVITR